MDPPVCANNRSTVSVVGAAVSCYRQLLQLRVLRSGLLQYGDVRIGVFPERKEVLVSSPGFGCIARYRVCAGEADAS